SITICAPEDRFGSRWSYTRCCNCGAAALVSLSEGTPVQVAYVPVSETLISTELYQPGMAIRRFPESVAVDPEGLTSVEPASAPASVNRGLRGVPILIGLGLAMAGIALFQYQKSALRQIQSAQLPASAPAPATSAPAEPPVVTKVVPVPVAVPVAIAEAPPSIQKETIVTQFLPLTVQPRVDSARLRTGPGIEFPTLGTANPTSRYIVKSWKDRWFEIEDPTQPNVSRVWIRNDLVVTTNKIEKN
ncbi:MAG: hypothetical protein AAB425_13000, partial [Bdellovibrionota bacterium]